MNRPTLRLSTALSLTLGLGVAGCAAQGLPDGRSFSPTDATAFQLPTAKQAPASSVATLPDLASIAPAAGGTVLFTRTEAVPTAAEQQDALRKLAEEVVQQHQQEILAAAAQQSQSLADASSRKTADQINAGMNTQLGQLTAQLKDYAAQNVSATAAQLRDYAYHVAGEAASQQASATEARVNATTTTQLADLRVENAHLQQQVARQTQAASSVAVQEVAKLRADNAQMQASLTRQDATTAAQVAQHTETELDRLRADNARLVTQLTQQQQTNQQATREVLSAQVAALDDKTQTRLNATQNLTDVRLAALDDKTATQVAAVKAVTAAQLAALDTASTARVTSLDLRQQANQQILAARLGAVKDTTTAQLAALDSKNTTQVAALNDTTTARLAALDTASTARVTSLDLRQQANQQILAARLGAVKDTTAAQLAALDSKNTTQVAALNDTTTARLAALGTQQQASQQILAERVATVKDTTAAQLAALDSKNTTQVGALKDTTTAQLNSLNARTDTRLAALNDTTAARLVAADQKNATQQQATRDMLAAQLTALHDTTSAQVAAVNEKATAQLDTLNQVTNLKLAALDNKTQSANELTQTKLAALNDKTSAQIAGLSQQQELTRQLAHQESLSVAQALHQYADTQLGGLQAENKQNLTRVAEAARLDVIDLEAATGQKLQEIQQQANRQAALLASKSAAQVEERVAAMEDSQLKPEQVRALASDVVSESTPEFRALALQSLAQSQDYIRTVARDSIKDGDPAVQQALANAAQQVITKDDKVVFAIRQAVDARLKQVAVGTPDDASGTTPKTVLGPDHGPEIRTADAADDIRIEAARLLVKAPGEPDEGPAPTGIKPVGNQGQLAMLNPNVSLGRVRNRADWVDLRSYRVVIHQDNQPLAELLNKVLQNAEPYTGPWQVKWKISPENQDVMNEKFSLDAETTFSDFINYVSQYMVNERGIKLTVNLFDTDHIMVISD